MKMLPDVGESLMKRLIVLLLICVVESALALDQGRAVYWSADDLKKGRAEPFMTPTHLFHLVHEAPGTDQQRVAQSHEGTTDVFFIVAGSATIVAGGEIEDAAALPGMPGEFRGRSIKGGRSYDLHAGAVINIPPSTPYLVQVGTGGLTAMQVKINVGMHPWSIVSTQQTTLAATPARPRMTAAQFRAGTRDVLGGRYTAEGTRDYGRGCWAWTAHERSS